MGEKKSGGKEKENNGERRRVEVKKRKIMGEKKSGG